MSLCQLNQDHVEIPNAIQDSLEDEGNQTAFVPNLDHNDVPNVMQELLKDEGKQKTFVPNPVEAELLMDLTDSEDTNSLLEAMESSTSNWFEVEKIMKTKTKEKGKQYPLSFTVTKVDEDEGLDDEDQHRPSNAQLTNLLQLEVPEVRDILQTTTASDTLMQNSITTLLSSKCRDIQKKLRQYGVESPKFRKRLVSKWESLNYDTVENVLYWREYDENSSKKKLTLRWLSRWVIVFFIGLSTALLAAMLHVIVENVAHAKFSVLSNCGHYQVKFGKDHNLSLPIKAIRDNSMHYCVIILDKCAKEGCMYQPALIWIAINLVITLLGSALVTYVEPMAAGSGIPMVKCYLNGVKIPGLLSLEAFICKVGGVVMAILGGLACGKEGPMAHSGSIIAAGLGKGRIRLCRKKRVSLYEGFRSDHDIRDFVAAGAASGVSAAFGAPVGGTLFSVEEAASFWNQELTWRVFFAAMVACFFTNFLLSSFKGNPNHLSAPGLVRFSVFKDLSFDLIEIPAFLIMAVIGGLIGAAFVFLNYKLTVFRKKFFHKKWIKVIEAGVVATCTGVIAFLLMYLTSDCTDKQPYDSHAIVTKMYCEENKHHSMSTLMLATPEGCLKALLHDPFGMFQPGTLALFTVVFFFLAVWTYGLSISSGVFIPSLVLGAAWGRLFGIGIIHLFPGDPHYQEELGKYALIGAASQLGGVLRTTISLTVMLVECTGNISFGLPIMITLMISKWVGDFFTTGLYDMNIEVSGIPVLPWEPPPLCDDIKANDLMSQPVAFFNQKEKVGHIIDHLKTETFNGFPVTSPNPENPSEPGKLLGLIMKSQLLVLLKSKTFAPEGMLQPSTIRLKDFRKYYHQYLKIDEIEISDEEKDYTMDLKPFLLPNPYTIDPTFSLPRLFKLFRGLGLRHLIVVNENHQPVGMITRKDLAKFRAESRRGLLKIKHLKIEDS